METLQSDFEKELRQLCAKHQIIPTLIRIEKGPGSFELEVFVRGTVIVGKNNI